VEKSVTSIYAKDITKKCFWNDYKSDTTDVDRIINEGSSEERAFLVSKIIQNYNFPELLTLLFDKDELASFFPVLHLKHEHQKIAYNNLKYFIYGDTQNESSSRHAWTI
jgi:hypothetical protein